MLNRWTLRKLTIAGLVILLVIAGGWGWFVRRQISGTCFGSQQARVLMPRMFSPDGDEKATPGYRWMGVLPWGGSGEAVLWADTEMRLLGKADLVAKVRSSAPGSRDDCRVETVEDVSLGEDAGFLVRGRVGTTRFVGAVLVLLRNIRH